MEELSIDIGDFWVGPEVKILENPSSIEFLRECVASYQPAILRGLTDDWPAMIEWDLARICEKLDQASGDRLLKVNLTPDGRADCLKSVSVCAPKISSDICTDISPEVYSDVPPSISSVSVPNITLKENGDSHTSESVFVYPAECYMPTSLFLEMMINPSEGDAVPYLSLQNDNLRMDMPELMGDVAASLRIAEEAFGQSQPEAGSNHISMTFYVFLLSPSRSVYSSPCHIFYFTIPSPPYSSNFLLISSVPPLSLRLSFCSQYMDR